MNVSIFPTGKGSATSAVNYLLSDVDHEGHERTVLPEILFGDPTSFVAIADSTKRQHKYTSGVIAFRDNEHITPDQLTSVIKAFRSTFLPGLKVDENFADFWVMHREKGNLELHFLYVNTEISSGSQLNIHPPGETNIRFFNTFTSVINHTFGFAQVVADPLKEALKPFEPRTSPNGKKYKKDGESLGTKLHKQILDGRISNRDQLLNFITDHKVEVNRVGGDYITVIVPGAKKGIRLHGELFKENGNYQQVIDAHHQSKVPLFLNQEQAEHKQRALAHHIQQRFEFNKKRYLSPKRSSKNAKFSNPRVNAESPPLKEKIATVNESVKQFDATKSLEKKLTAIKNSSYQPQPLTVRRIKAISEKFRNSGNQNDSQSDLSSGSGAIGGIEAQIGSLSLQYHTLLIQLAGAKGSRAQKLRSMLAKIEAKLSQLNLELEKARVNNGAKDKPKI